MNTHTRGKQGIIRTYPQPGVLLLKGGDGDDCPFPCKPILHKRSSKGRSEDKAGLGDFDKMAISNQQGGEHLQDHQHRRADWHRQSGGIRVHDAQAIHAKKLMIGEKLWRVEEKIKQIRSLEMVEGDGVVQGRGQGGTHRKTVQDEAVRRRDEFSVRDARGEGGEEEEEYGWSRRREAEVAQRHHGNVKSQGEPNKSRWGDAVTATRPTGGWQRREAEVAERRRGNDTEVRGQRGEVQARREAAGKSRWDNAMEQTGKEDKGGMAKVRQHYKNTSRGSDGVKAHGEYYGMHEEEYTPQLYQTRGGNKSREAGVAEHRQDNTEVRGQRANPEVSRWDDVVAQTRRRGTERDHPARGDEDVRPQDGRETVRDRQQKQNRSRARHEDTHGHHEEEGDETHRGSPHPPPPPSPGPSLSSRPRAEGPGPSLAATTSALVPCAICDRKFAKDRLEVHMRICQKVKMTKSRRQKFDSKANRIRGTDNEQFLKNNIRSKTPEILKKKRPTPNKCGQQSPPGKVTSGLSAQTWSK